jgi:hypothetical protein
MEHFVQPNTKPLYSCLHANPQLIFYAVSAYVAITFSQALCIALKVYTLLSSDSCALA